jgi:hypothetical protein
MAKNFWKVVNKVIEESDVLLLVLDARLAKETRNKEIEDKVKKSEKPLIYVITKCDLVPKENSEKLKKSFRPSVFVSSKEYHGMNLLRERILIEAKRAYPEFKKYFVGVLGYPNVGKSSLINAMKGKSSASTSMMSGHTKGVQKVKADNKIVFLDSPGVIPYKEKDNVKHAFIGTTDFTKVKDPDLVVIDLIDTFPGIIEKYYDVPISDDAQETIELIAKKKNLMKKGAKPDVMKAARQILKGWQTGKIKPH